MRPRLRLVVYLLATLALGISTGAASGPVLRVQVTQVSVPAEPGISVEASDAAGLDSLSITWPEGDLTYQTQLSGVSNLKRSFRLSEIFPQAADMKGQIQLMIAVRNTRGETASTRVVVPSQDRNKGK
jgi:hypothetical protein